MVILQLYGFRDFSQREAKKLTHLGVPKPMRVVGFAMMAAGGGLFFLPALLGQGHTDQFGDPSLTLSFVGFEIVIATSGAMLGYSFLHFRDALAGRRCPAGHAVSPVARFCEVCGAAVT
jgi:hypothetical protein